MKIGIITFQETKNFGACLQALALYKKVEELGHQPELLDYRNDCIYRNEIRSILPYNSLKSFARWFIYGHKLYSKYKTLQTEMKNYCRFSKKLNKSNISTIADDYDRFLVGSDQVWALNLTDYDYTYMLDFVIDEKKKYSFASSIGNEDIFRQDVHAHSLIKDFNMLSVRESEAVTAIKDCCAKDVEWVCDPTMLYDAHEWDAIVNPTRHFENYVFIYFTDPQNKIFKDALAYANKHNLKVLFDSPLRCNITGVQAINPKSMGEFIGLIKYANAVFTASYHGMLFSLYYGKPFMFYNRNQKSRMDSLSRVVGVEKNSGEFYEGENIPDINYAVVSDKISDFRKRSLSVLKSTIK